jgi:hypothetical protein
MSYEIRQDAKFKFIEEGNGETLMLLHGLFGALSNFQDLIEHFKKSNQVVVPILPLLDLDLLHTSVGGLSSTAIIIGSTSWAILLVDMLPWFIS